MAASDADAAAAKLPVARSPVVPAGPACTHGLCDHPECWLHALAGCGKGFLTGWTLRSAFMLGISMLSPRLWSKNAKDVRRPCSAPHPHACAHSVATESRPGV